MGAFKTGALVGFGIGYLRGAKAGRPRYEQITRKFKQMDLGSKFEPVKAQIKPALSTVVEKTSGLKDKLGSGSKSSEKAGAASPSGL